MRLLNSRSSPRGILMPYGTGILQSAPSGALINGVLDGTNPGTRESYVTAHRIQIETPTLVKGIAMPLGGALTVNTDIKYRFAIFTSNGQRWRGVSNTSTALPWDLVVGDTTSTALSAMKTDALAAVNGRYISASLPETWVPPGLYWILCLQEGVYAADVANSGVFWGADTAANVPHQLGSTGASRGVAFGAVQTTAINSAVWTTFVQQAASSWVISTGSAGNVNFASARTLTGASASLNFQWGLVVGSDT